MLRPKRFSIFVQRVKITSFTSVYNNDVIVDRKGRSQSLFAKRPVSTSLFWFGRFFRHVSMRIAVLDDGIAYSVP